MEYTVGQHISDTLNEVEWRIDHGQRDKYWDRYMRAELLAQELEELLDNLDEDLNNEEITTDEDILYIDNKPTRG